MNFIETIDLDKLAEFLEGKDLEENTDLKSLATYLAALWSVELDEKIAFVVKHRDVLLEVPTWKAEGFNSVEEWEKSESF